MDNTKQAYESVIPLFKLMIEIKGGTTYVKQLLETYLTQYKRRHALVKVFNEFKESNRKLK
jgi:carbohydrate-binding DOMON domain-containing protein